MIFAAAVKIDSKIPPAPGQPTHNNLQAYFEHTCPLLLNIDPIFMQK